MQTDYAYTLMKKYPGKQFVLYGDDYAGLSWLDGSQKPTKEELDAAYLEVREEDEAKRLATAYLEKRRAEKPGLQEQLEMMEELGFEGWRNQMQAINAKHKEVSRG